MASPHREVMMAQQKERIFVISPVADADRVVEAAIEAKFLALPTRASRMCFSSSRKRSEFGPLFHLIELSSI